MTEVGEPAAGPRPAPADAGRPALPEALFDPVSVAVVGASGNPAKWGYWLAKGALAGRGRRAVHLVNPGRRQAPEGDRTPGNRSRSGLTRRHQR